MLQYCCFSELTAQQCAYGFPRDEVELHPKTIIIVNLPLHSNGRFISSQSLDGLFDFLEKHDTLNFCLEINEFHGGRKMSKHYSDGLANSLRTLLKARSLKNC